MHRRVGRSDAMPLLRVDLKTIWLALFYQGVDQLPCVGKVDILIDHSMNYQKPVFPLKSRQKQEVKFKIISCLVNTNPQNNCLLVRELACQVEH